MFSIEEWNKIFLQASATFVDVKERADIEIRVGIAAYYLYVHMCLS